MRPQVMTQKGGASSCGLRQPAEGGSRWPVEPVPAAVVAAFGLTSGPGREREFDGQRHRDLRLADEHGAGFGEGCACPLTGRQEAVLGSAGLGGVEAPDDLDAGVGHDPPFDLAGGLLGADQDDAEARPRSAMSSRTSLIGTVALAGCVLVELVDHGEQQAARPGRLFAGGFRGQHDADDETLGPLAEVVQVDDGDLLVAGGDLPGPGVGQVARG